MAKSGPVFSCRRETVVAGDDAVPLRCADRVLRRKRHRRCFLVDASSPTTPFFTRGAMSGSSGILPTARPTFAHEGEINFSWGFYPDFDLTIAVPIVTNHLESASPPTRRGTGLLGQLVSAVQERDARLPEPRRSIWFSWLRRGWIQIRSAEGCGGSSRFRGGKLE